MIPKQGDSYLRPQFIAPQADPNSKQWKSVVNTSVLPARRDVKPLPIKPDPHSILHPPVMQTPQATSGTLLGEDGSGSGKRRSHIRGKGKR